MDDLKPCPFCGGMAVYEEMVEHEPPFRYKVGHVECVRCHVQTDKYSVDGYMCMKLTKDEIVRKWNRRTEMKRTYTAARRQGYKQAIELLCALPGAKEKPISLAPAVIQSPAPLHACWFYDGGWVFCDNCGGKSGSGGYTRFCPHCGARMDRMPEIE